MPVTKESSARNAQRKRYEYEQTLYQALMLGVVSGIITGAVTGDSVLAFVVIAMGTMVFLTLLGTVRDQMWFLPGGEI